MWIWLVLLYGILKGLREVAKKKSLEKSSVIEVLFFYTLIGFIMVIPGAFHMGAMPIPYYFYIAVKSFVIFIAWICSFKAIKKLPISVYGIFDLSRVLFATLLGVFVLGETLGVYQLAGLILVCVGLLLLRIRPWKREKTEEEKTEICFILLAFASCLLNAVSGLLDKILMKEINSSQLQFWYMLYLVLFYLVYLLLSKTKVNIKATLQNYWIWILSLMFVIGDKALFVANGMPESRITVMTLIKQSGCIISILAGKFIFKEKGIRHKILCAAIIIAGIVISVMD